MNPMMLLTVISVLVSVVLGIITFVYYIRMLIESEKDKPNKDKVEALTEKYKKFKLYTGISFLILLVITFIDNTFLHLFGDKVKLRDFIFS